MSVAMQMGLADPEQGLLAEARSRWPQWCRQVPELSVAGDLLEVPAWLSEATGEGAGPSTRAQADALLHALARLGSPRGGDDLAATAALAYLLLPGACLLAARLRTLSHDIDQLVAAQLWLEIRTFAWERLMKVSANILLNTRKRVLREALPEGCALLEPSPTTWQAIEHHLRPHVEAAAVAARNERKVHELLAQAVAEDVITDPERALLIDLAEAASLHKVCDKRALAGLYSRPVLAALARDRGCSLSTIRRRADASLRAVADAYAPLKAAS